MNKYGAEFFGTFWLVLDRCGRTVLGAAFPNAGIGCDMKSYLVAVLILLALFAPPLSAADVGSIKSTEGQAWIQRSDKQVPAKEGARIMVSDILKTGADGAMGIILRDDTIISMGPNSQMVLAEFLFQPEQKKLGMLTQFLKGSFTYISGVMAKLDPESVKVETPVGMVAIRGTHFLIKVEE